jgi:hypothetical protein
MRSNEQSELQNPWSVIILPKVSLENFDLGLQMFFSVIVLPGI